MNTIFDYAIERVRKGARFKVSFQTRTLIVGGKKAIDNGVFEGELGIGQVPCDKALDYIDRAKKPYSAAVFVFFFKN